MYGWMRFLLRWRTRVIHWATRASIGAVFALTGCGSPIPDFQREAARAAGAFPAPVITLPELITRLGDGSSTGVMLVDTRAPSEFLVSHLPGAIHWPDFGNQPLPTSVTLHVQSGGTVVFYCSIGYRSGEACVQAASLHPGGNFLNLRGGIFQWSNEGRTLAGGNLVHGFNSRWERHLRPCMRAGLNPSASATVPTTK